jgi:hypothetical protein
MPHDDIIETKSPVCYTIPPDTESRIMIKTLSNGVCTLHPIPFTF